MQLVCFPPYFHIMVQLTLYSIICKFKALVAFVGVQSSAKPCMKRLVSIFPPGQAQPPLWHTALLMYCYLSTLSLSVTDGEQPFHTSLSRPASEHNQGAAIYTISLCREEAFWSNLLPPIGRKGYVIKLCLSDCLSVGLKVSKIFKKVRNEI